MRPRFFCLFCFVFLLWMAPPRGALGAESALRLATTTSTENSGLLAYLLPFFTKETGIEVHVIATGTGAALALARRGDVDVVLVHSPPDEARFVGEGSGVQRREVMANDFVIAGPADDPAGVSKAGSAVEAFRAIAGQRAPFISRGDKSGTHVKERALWAGLGLEPSWPGYIEAGQGMGACLVLADEKGAYLLTDRGTFLAYQSKIRLGLLHQGSADLWNPYGIIATNPAKSPLVRFAQASRLIQWMTSPKGQELIHSFRVHGKVLFFPTVVSVQEEGRAP